MLPRMVQVDNQDIPTTGTENPAASAGGDCHVPELEREPACERLKADSLPLELVVQTLRNA